MKKYTITPTIGFWLNKKGTLISSNISKKNIPAWSRLIVSKCKSKKTDNSPDFVGFFMPSKVPTQDLWKYSQEMKNYAKMVSETADIVCSLSEKIRWVDEELSRIRDYGASAITDDIFSYFNDVVAMSDELYELYECEVAREIPYYKGTPSYVLQSPYQSND